MEEETRDERIFARFEKYQDFLDTQRALLSLDLTAEPSSDEDRTREWQIAKKLRETLDEYQEQAYLLDPFLDSLVTPVVDCLRRYVKAFVDKKQTPESTMRLKWVAEHMYQYIKFRGYKTISRFFPHEIADLTIALEYMLLPNSPALVRWNWSLRYVVLLWLSLVCMIPFDLEQFDESDCTGETAEKLESLGKKHLNNAGLERDAAAILLARLYMRKDTSVKFPGFIAWSAEITRGPVEPFLTMGLLQVLCEVMKSGSVELVKTHASAILDVTNAVQANSPLLQNTLIRKFRSKLISRTVLRLLPATPLVTRSKGRTLTASNAGEELQAEADLDFDVPEELESVLEDLFGALQDKDTLVRWSAAKGVARISERLPTDFARQVLDNVVNLFSIHSIAAATIYDMPSIAEGTWHGACLACAEMARRGLVADDALGDLIDWQCKALYFDIRKGAHSVGSNVRDAACYVLWSLARAQRPAVLEPFAEKLSRSLVAVALFDREIHIRRAASATFQEFVGRTSLFAHGIDVLRKTDFYSVGIRRSAFLVAAPEVAEHVEYRSSLIDHLLSVTLRHWDPQMRQLGAQSLRVICELDLPALGPDSAARAARFLQGPDVGDIHGALAALTELAAAYRDSSHDLEAERRKVFAYLLEVPLNIVESSRHDLVTTAACNLIANGISPAEISSEETSVPHWRRVVDIGLKSKNTAVQEAAADAMAAVSKLVDCSAVVDRLIGDFNGGSPPVQQSLCRVLGVFDYAAYPHGIFKAIDRLLKCVDRSDPAMTVDVEARRNAFNSMPLILSNVVSKLSNQLSPAVVCQMIDAMQDGLTDYTSDERGDVGSWVRIACVKGLTSFAEILFPAASSLQNYAEYFPSAKYHAAVGGILKQGVERLDNVRQLAGECFMRLLVLPLPAISGAEQWQIHGHTLIKTLFLSETETINWNEGDKLFPKAVRLLEIEPYREAVLAGLVLSASTKTDSTQRPVTASLVGYARGLPVSATQSGRYDQCRLAQDLVTQASRNLASNNIVVPVLQTFNVLLESDVCEELSDDPAGLQSLRALLSIATRNVARLKNHQRIVMSMRIVVNLLSMHPLREECVAHLASFLAHQYPKVRSDTAEHLYLVLQTKDLGFETDEAEEILLNTEWSTTDMSAVEEASRRCVKLLSAQGW
ncbi:ARM repeat-containing protein [Daedalea quercina L-15889]|uniref:ARM repeat-containing protein n=1 Tax=Daedalea quercina L-15889 TaxID=1314783 RepID=A0A165TQL1_9APHY|nr:ARM repeat-containing protein [Daedalea quercina L-15889]